MRNQVFRGIIPFTSSWTQCCRHGRLYLLICCCLISGRTSSHCFTWHFLEAYVLIHLSAAHKILSHVSSMSYNFLNKPNVPIQSHRNWKLRVSVTIVIICLEFFVKFWKSIIFILLFNKYLFAYTMDYINPWCKHI